MKCSMSGCGAYARITYIYACRDLRPVSKEMDLPRRKILHWHTCFALVGTYAPVSPQSQSSANIIF